jgi:hypothetical protein
LKGVIGFPSPTCDKTKNQNKNKKITQQQQAQQEDNNNTNLKFKIKTWKQFCSDGIHSPYCYVQFARLIY